MDIRLKTLILLWLVGAMLLSAPYGVMAEIYSWTDENGVRHYSNTQPQDYSIVRVTPEVSHDQSTEQKNSDDYRQMVEKITSEHHESKDQELEKRLEKTERLLMDAEKKAESALKAAQEARTIALEKQRHREIYVVPWIGPHPIKNTSPLPYQPPYSQPNLHPTGRE